MLEILLLVAFVLLPLIQQFLRRRPEASLPPARRPVPRATVPAPASDGPAAAPPLAKVSGAGTPAATASPVQTVSPALVVRRRGRNRPRGWRFNESDARRAIVLTAVFGPCRALAPYEG